MTTRSFRRARSIGALFTIVNCAIAAHPAAAAEYAFNARFDWVSEGEIYQVWFHREFDGHLVPTAPIEITSHPDVVALLEGATLQCTAAAKIGLPNWSVVSGTCVLRNATGGITIEVVECTGTQSRCEGWWRIIAAEGELAGTTGTGTMTGLLVDPDPLPWFYNGPILGFNVLDGALDIP